jgi:hypothetical protein
MPIGEIQVIDRTDRIGSLLILVFGFLSSVGLVILKIGLFFVNLAAEAVA